MSRSRHAGVGRKGHLATVANKPPSEPVVIRRTGLLDSRLYSRRKSRPAVFGSSRSGARSPHWPTPARESSAQAVAPRPRSTRTVPSQTDRSSTRVSVRRTSSQGANAETIKEGSDHLLAFRLLPSGASHRKGILAPGMLIRARGHSSRATRARYRTRPRLRPRSPPRPSIREA